MVSLAVGLIIGTAFSLLVNALANDVINQMLAKTFGYRSLAYLLVRTTRWERVWVYIGDAEKAVAIKGLPLNGIMYGKFLSTLISFVVTTLFLFSVAFISFFIARRFVIKKHHKTAPKSTNDLMLNELKKINKCLQLDQKK